ncbi:integrase [Rhodococcus sp. LBL1]|nr:integrase [Rhodococcus sp. LBL1]MDH6684008.1 integrase [Rhodococcus sp. LBL2]
MAGRPPLRIGQHGKVTRKDLGGGSWLARCRFRDSDGVVRIVERRSPVGRRDQYGKCAEEELLDALDARRAPSSDDISESSTIRQLCDLHIDRLEEEGRAARTLDTYRYTASKLYTLIGGVRVGEATVSRVDSALRGMSKSYGVVMARQSRTILKGALGIAVLAGVLDSNPVGDVSAIRAKRPPQGAKQITADGLRSLLEAIRSSERCGKLDLTDPITMLIATGMRRSELLALRWQDVNADAATVSVAGKVVRVKGEGLKRFDEAKSAAGLRTIPLPRFAMEMLEKRAQEPRLGTLGMIFPSTAGTLRDPDNFNGQWRQVRDELGVTDVTSHSFRKAVATLLDDEGLSARIGADHLGHRHVSMTQDRYMARGRTHAVVAETLDRAINDE